MPDNSYSREFASYDNRIKPIYGYVKPSDLADELDMRLEEYGIGGVTQELFDEMLSDYDARVSSKGDLTDDIAYIIFSSHGLM